MKPGVAEHFGIGLDLRTVLVMSALVITLATAVFAATTVLRHVDEASRTWTSGFAMATCAGVLYGIWGDENPPPLAVVASISAAMIFAVGALWCGARLFNGRERSLVWVPLAGAILTAVLVYSLGRGPDQRLGSGISLGVSGVLGWVGSLEVGAGPMRRDPSSRLMQITLAVVGLTYVGAAAIHVAVDYPVPPGAPISRLVVVVFVALVIVATICLSALRGAGTGGQRATPDSGGAPRALPLLEPETFRLVARDRLERASLVDAELSLVLAEVNDLAEINTAFGRESGDAVLAHFSRVVRSRVPVSAILGYLGGGRFGIMTTSDSRVTAATVVAAVRTGLSDSHVSPDMDLRIDASFGVSDTTTTPANIDLLLDAAVVDMARFARSALPNT